LALLDEKESANAANAQKNPSRRSSHLIGTVINHRLHESLHFAMARRCSTGCVRTSESFGTLSSACRCHGISPVPHIRMQDINRRVVITGRKRDYALHWDDHNDPCVTAQGGRFKTVFSCILRVPYGRDGMTLITRCALEADERSGSSLTIMHPAGMPCFNITVHIRNHITVVMESIVGRAVVWYHSYSRYNNHNNKDRGQRR